MNRFDLAIALILVALLAVAVYAAFDKPKYEVSNPIALNGRAGNNGALAKYGGMASFDAAEPAQEAQKSIFNYFSELNKKLVEGEDSESNCVYIGDLQNGPPEKKLNIFFVFSNNFGNKDKEKIVKEIISGKPTSLLNTPPFSKYKQNINIGYYSENLEFSCPRNQDEFNGFGITGKITNECGADIVILLEVQTTEQNGVIGASLNRPDPAYSTQLKLIEMGTCVKWNINEGANDKLLWLIKHEIGHTYGPLDHYPLLYRMNEKPLDPNTNTGLPEKQFPFIARIIKEDLEKRYDALAKNVMYLGYGDTQTWDDDPYSQMDSVVLEENLKKPVKITNTFEQKMHQVAYVKVDDPTAVLSNDKIVKGETTEPVSWMYGADSQSQPSQ
ncbi:MAG: hypothetical protein NTZ73_02845 [Candidatus Diapherotrites archaeon]|nr:hypothetical protein [Candidatus Diapherotrites archaeon]